MAPIPRDFLNPFSQKCAHVDQKLSIVRIRWFGQFCCQRTRKICGIAWVCKKNLIQKFRLSADIFRKKIAEISDMDWAQNIMMDYSQNLRKDPTKAKKITVRRFTGCLIGECVCWNGFKWRKNQFFYELHD